MRKCIKCKTAVATVREKYDPETHVYCGLACQKQYYSIGLKTGQDEAGPAIDDDDVVGLIGSKGEKIRETQSAAGKDRADAAGGELLDCIVAAVCRVEITRDVKG